MFEAVELGQKLSREEFKQREPGLWTALLEAQRALREAGVATLIVVAGVEGGGKGEAVQRLHKWFDTRGMRTHAFWDATDEENERPAAWRFWQRLPPRGAIAVMFGGWYWDPLHRYVRGDIGEAELEREALRIVELERMLRLDGMLIVKLWFHIPRKAHAQRLKKRREVQRHIAGVAGEGDTPSQYEDFLGAAERMIRHTDTAACPWSLIDAEDAQYRDLRAGEILRALMEERLNRSAAAVAPAALPAAARRKQATVLDRVDLTAALADETYKREMKHCRERLAQLAWRAYDARRSCVLVFEGWDAAGKGGAIQRLTAAVDARLYQVIPVAAPTDEERAHHYLWRFWRHLPRAGYMTLYDRSWYGRVLVERVEGYASEAEWARAYEEINNFEERLTGHGIVLLKFWLHISADEQLRRFEERGKLPWKKHKLGAEDWRNRDKRAAYLAAVDDMVVHTSTAEAPWVLVPAENKNYARVEIMQTVCKRLERALAS
ncbi:MAG: polyphosphate:AMP phosphotransferase [Gammaproteobacteria bacterium]|nr:polyphosphate:AMP phosphotransferase [Gammaproteobacteria bacterium]